MGVSETEIMFEVREALASTGAFLLWRNNTGMDTRTRTRYGLGTGSPDLIGVARASGVMIGIEIKRPGEYLSENQITWHCAAHAAGVRVICVDNATDAVRLLQTEIDEWTQHKRLLTVQRGRNATLTPGLIPSRFIPSRGKVAAHAARLIARLSENIQSEPDGKLSE